MTNEIQGMTEFAVNGVANLIVAWYGLVWRFDGPTVSLIYGSSLNTAGNCVMVPANGLLYVLDASGSLYSTDGLTVSTLTLQDASGNVIQSIQDMTWFMAQMFYVAGDFLYFSQVNLPTSIVNSAINVAVGDGGMLRRGLPYRNGLLILF